MAKGIRSKIKKRLRTVKRGVIKREMKTPGTVHHDREVSKASKAKDALSGYLEPGKQRKNAFRSDDPEAEIPQHDWRQGPDFRSSFAAVDEGCNTPGLAVWGTSRPKQDPRGNRVVASAAGDNRYERLTAATNQLVPFMANKKTKKRIKGQIDAGSDKISTRSFRWV